MLEFWVNFHNQTQRPQRAAPSAAAAPAIALTAIHLVVPRRHHVDPVTFYVVARDKTDHSYGATTALRI